MIIWLVKHMTVFMLVAMASGTAACLVSLRRKRTAYALLWLVAFACVTTVSVLAKVVTPPLVHAATVEHGVYKSAPYPHWYLPTTVSLQTIAVLATIVGSALFMFRKLPSDEE